MTIKLFYVLIKIVNKSSKGKSIMYNVRKITNKILDRIEDGSLASELVILACMNYMSETSVADMAQHNGWFEDDSDDEDEQDDNEDE